VKNKVILGTVQLGLPYGVNNSSGQPEQREAFDILTYAFDHGITTLDSADNYGEAIFVIGKYIKSSHRKFNVINKFKIDQTPLIDKLRTSLSILGQSSLHCYMFHQFSDYATNQVRDLLLGFKRDGLIRSIGLSIYSLDELKIAVNDSFIDIIQLPVNILDLSEEKKELLKKARQNGKEIHARSVFLQGLLLKEPETLTGNLVPLKSYLKQLQEMAKTHNSSVKKLALNYILAQDSIDKVVLGVEKQVQLQDNLELIDPYFQKNELMDVVTVSDDHKYLLNPVNWRL
jgi:aryl-alcohol dehydrogenase-like predicted oxidoreductase